MDKNNLRSDIGLLSIAAAYIGKDMKLEGDDLKRVITDEEMHLVNMYAELALAIGNLSKAIDALPD